MTLPPLALFVAVKHLKVEKNTSENASHFEFVEEKGRDDEYMHVLVTHLLYKS